jgi:predicted  nucleic acid-binding Zn-ribbon protein
MIDIKTPEEQIIERMAAVEEVVIDLTQKVKQLEKYVLTLDERISKAEVTKAKNGMDIMSLKNEVRIINKRINKEI